jgi:FixJ family two-component response regulator
LPQPPIVSIIDDDISVRVAVADIVRSMDLTAKTFASGQDFLSANRLADTACIVADVQMPGISGIELQQALTAKELKIPMIFITAYPDERVRDKALEGGAICFLNKPFGGPAIIECIERALRIRDATNPGDAGTITARESE